MFCSDCGQRSDPGDRFCAGCGEELVAPGDPLARYQLGDQLGAGSSGVVYFAYEADLHRPVAVKALAPGLIGHPGFLSRFRAEAAVMARLDDPHCVRVYDFVEAAQGAWVVMEYVPGASLRVVLASTSYHLSPEQCMGVLKGALQGLAHAHDLGLVHRDVKPDNILVDPKGNSKLADFGLTTTDPQATSPLAGTPAYMSPEQVRGERVDHRSDLYSAGVVLYEMLTGACPYVGDSPAQVASMHALAPLPATSAMPAPVGTMVARALAKQPEDRQQSAGQLLNELEVAAAASYGPDWATRASVAALIGAVAGGAGAAIAAGATTAASAVGGAQSAAATTGASSGSLAAPAQVAAGSGAHKGIWAKLGATKLGLAGQHPVAATVLTATLATGAVVGGLAATMTGSTPAPLTPAIVHPPPPPPPHGGEGVVSEQGTVGSLRFGSSTQADVQAFAGTPDATDAGSVEPDAPQFAPYKALGYQCSGTQTAVARPLGASIWCQTVYYLNARTGILVGFDTGAPSFHTTRGSTAGMSIGQAQQLEGQQSLSGCLVGIWLGTPYGRSPTGGAAPNPATVLIQTASGAVNNTVGDLQAESNSGGVGLFFC
jgi:hypothetical protein